MGLDQKHFTAVAASPFARRLRVWRSKLRAATAMAMTLTIGVAGVPLEAQTNQAKKHFLDQSVRPKVEKLVPMNSDGSVNVAQMRTDLATLKKSRIAAVRELAARGERFLEIAAAESAPQRSALIQELANDRVIDKIARNAAAGADMVSGNSADAMRSGPSADAGSSCFEGEPEPCATEQEEAELAAVLGAASNEIGYVQSQHDSAYANYCAQYGCSADVADVSGPSAVPPDNCAPHTSASVIAVGHAISTAGWGYGRLGAAAAAGIRLSAAAVLGTHAAIAFAVAGAVTIVAYTIECYLYLYSIADAELEIDFVGPLVCPARLHGVLNGF